MYFQFGTFWSTEFIYIIYFLFSFFILFGFVFGKRFAPLLLYTWNEIFLQHGVLRDWIIHVTSHPTPCSSSIYNNTTLQYQTKFSIFLLFSSAPPLQRWSLFIRKEIAGLVRAQEIVLLHLHHVLRLIRFLELQTVHRGRFRWQQQIFGYGAALVVVLLVQDCARIAVGRTVFEVHWEQRSASETIVVVETLVVQLFLGFPTRFALALFHRRFVFRVRHHYLLLHWNPFFQPQFKLLYLQTLSVQFNIHKQKHSQVTFTETRLRVFHELLLEKNKTKKKSAKN